MNNFEPRVETPKKTYIERIDRAGIFKKSFDEKLRDYVNMPGTLVIISSNSKHGKSVLIHKNIENYVIVNGNELKISSIYKTIAEKINKKSPKISLKSIGVGPVNLTTSTNNYEIETKRQVEDYLSKNSITLVIDDIQYCVPEVIDFLAKEIKSLIVTIKVVVTSHPREINILMNSNPDLNGRVEIIEMPSWNDEELKSLAIKGFGKEVSNLNLIVNKSLGSPFLLQLLGYEMVKNKGNFTPNYIDKCVQEITRTFTHQKFIDELPTLEKNQKLYEINGQSMDIIMLVLFVLTIDPMSQNYTYSEFEGKLQSILPDDLNITRQFKRNLNKFEMFDSRLIAFENERIEIYDVTLLLYLKYNFFKKK